MASTGYKSVEIRHCTDEKIINEVINSIIKYMIRKIKKFEYCNANTLLLICPNLEIKDMRYIFSQNKSKKHFIIPCILKKYLNDDTIQVEVKVDYDNIPYFPEFGHPH